MRIIPPCQADTICTSDKWNMCARICGKKNVEVKPSMIDRWILKELGLVGGWNLADASINSPVMRGEKQIGEIQLGDSIPEAMGIRNERVVRVGEYFVPFLL